MQPANSRSVLGLGFFSIAALFFAIVAIWLAMVSNHNSNLRHLSLSEAQRQWVFAMRDAAHQRNLALFRMAALQDAFARDSEYLRFKEAAGNFIAARQQLLSNQLSSQLNDYTVELWDELKPLIQHSEQLQNSIVDLILEDNTAAALSLIQEEFIPIQRQVSRLFSKMLDSARNDIQIKLDTANAAAQTHYQIILLLVLLASAVGYAIAKTVVRRNDDAHNVLLNKNRQINAINDALSQPHTNVEEQIQTLLRLGCEYSPLESGLLLKRNADENATVLIRYPANQDNPDAVLLNDFWPSCTGGPTPGTGDRPHIALPLQTAGSARYCAVFFSGNPVALSVDTRDLLQLIGNKLIVLLDHQETLEQLQDAKLAAEAANKAKNVFLANLTDELRNPLLSIMEQNQSLGEKLSLLDEAQHFDEQEHIQDCAQQLNTLIGNLLDITQLESGSMSLQTEPIEIGTLLRDIETEANALMNHGEHRFELQTLDELGNMLSDGGRIRQVLVNLISFCFRCNRRADIGLTAWREPSPDGDWLYLEIKNTGNGISKKQLNHMFKLNIADSPDQETTAGPDIQLGISKKICERLGGDILVESTPDHATTFTICLPCHALAPAALTHATG